MSKKILLIFVTALVVVSFSNITEASIIGDWMVTVTEKIKIKIKGVGTSVYNNTYTENWSFTEDGKLVIEGDFKSDWHQSGKKVEVNLDSEEAEDRILSVFQKSAVEFNTHDYTLQTIVPRWSCQGKKDGSLKGKYKIKGTYENGEGQTAKVQIITKFIGIQIFPTTPTNLQGSAFSLEEIELWWEASADDVAIAGYNIYHDGVKIGSVSGTEARVQGLQPGTEYCFTVTAFDADNNESGHSNQVCVTTDGFPITTGETWNFEVRSYTGTTHTGTYDVLLESDTSSRTFDLTFTQLEGSSLICPVDDYVFTQGYDYFQLAWTTCDLCPNTSLITFEPPYTGCRSLDEGGILFAVISHIPPWFNFNYAFDVWIGEDYITCEPDGSVHK